MVARGILLILVAVSSSTGMVAQMLEKDEQIAVLNVSGQGQVAVSPDQATVRFGVTEIAQTAALAQQSVNRIMNSILVKMKDLGIEEKNTQTERIQLYPIQEPHQRDREPRITGYRAANSLRIKLDDITRVGEVLDAATQVGGNEIQGIDFSLRDDSEARAEALRLAISKARAKATVMADALGVRLLRVLEVTESGGGGMPVRYRAARMQAEALDSTPVAAGQVTISATVNIRYQIGPKA